MQGDLGRLHVGVLPLYLGTVHEVAEGVQSLRFPMYRSSTVLVHRRAIGRALDVEGLEVVHGARHQITCRDDMQGQRKCPKACGLQSTLLSKERKLK